MKKLLVLFVFIFAIALVPARAFAQVPDTVTGVLVEYPECQGDSCSFTQASCSWNAVSGASSYNYVITEVDTSTQIQSATVDSSTLRVVFPVTQERTYKCDVFATSSGGESGGTGTHSLLCSTEGLIDTPTPTTAVSTPVPTKPAIESPGAFETSAVILGALTLVIIGGLVLMLL